VGVAAGEAVEVEVEGVEAGSDVAASFLIPWKGDPWARVKGAMSWDVWFDRVTPSAGSGQALRKRWIAGECCYQGASIGTPRLAAAVWRMAWVAGVTGETM